MKFENNIYMKQQHIVAYIDLLGFKNAIKQEENLEIIEGMLNNIQQYNDSHASISTIKFEDFEENICNPAVLCVSDSIIISYPTITCTIDVILNSLCMLMVSLADIALCSGFLIRGGVAKGNMYHLNKIIFGKAYNRAYTLESEIANYPRIIIDKDVIDDKQVRNPEFIKSFYAEDIDGLYIMNFIQYLSSGSNFNKYLTIINNTINALEEGNIKSLVKWRWFKHHFLKSHLQS